MHHGDPIAESHQLGQVPTGDEDRLSFTGQSIEQVVDLDLAADVDAAIAEEDASDEELEIGGLK